MTFHKTSLFEGDLQEIASIAKTLSHPARLAIMRYLARSNACISGDISDVIPLSRTSVSQHLQELKKAGLIHGEIDGTKVCYCICPGSIKKVQAALNSFFSEVGESIANACNK